MAHAASLLIKNEMKNLMTFLKGVLGGLTTVIVAWVFIVCVASWRVHVADVRKGATGLGAQANGWEYLLSTLVAILRAIAYGLGLFTAVRFR